jgi:diadenosine tetraphosphate (Ap4A) HIT family hydrolase
MSTFLSLEIAQIPKNTHSHIIPRQRVAKNQKMFKYGRKCGQSLLATIMAVE